MTHDSAILIRPATKADQEALGRLGALLVSVHHGFDAQRFMAPGPGTARGYGGYLVSQIDEEDVIVLVAEEAGQVAGYTYAGIEGTDYMALRGPAGVVYDLVVDPERRRRGVGGLLLRETLARLIARGAPRVVLSTAHRNEAAQRLFAAAGFRPTMIEMTWDPPAGD